MSLLKSRAEIEILDRCNRMVLTILDELEGRVGPGVTTAELENYAEGRIAALGVKPAFKGYRGYPCVLCTSVNEEIVHGIPGKRVLEEGDIISIDLGLILDGYYGDAAATFPVGRIGEDAQRLVNTTREALLLAVDAAVVGNRVSDVSHVIQQHAESRGYSVVRDFVGHGVGHSLHEEPQVPNYGAPGHGARLLAGMVLAFEPMINMGTYKVVIAEDNWTASTADKRLSAHFEYSVAVTSNGPRILGR